MAFTAREVIMTFRGQNYLSGAIRRIGYDVGGLSRGAVLANQRAALQTRAAQLQYARSTAQQELYSVTRGQRSLALAQARNSLSRSEAMAVERVHNVETQRLRNMSAMTVAQEKNARLLQAQASGAAFVGRGVNRMSTAAALKASTLDIQRLQGEAARLAESYTTANIAMSQHGLRAQQVAAQDAALVQREAQLQQVIMSRSRAIDENRIAQIANNFEATKVAPIQAWEQRAASIEHAGRAMSMFGLIATAAMGFAATAAAKFNSQFTLAATQARPPGQGAEFTARLATDIQKRVMGMMQEFPASAQEMADSFYQIFSGTNIQNVKVASDAVRVFNQMAVAGSASLKDMTDAGITMYNNFGGLHGEFKNLTDAGNAFFATVRYGRMNAEQFANALPMVAAQAKMVGLSFQDIAGAMATLTRQTGGRLTSRDATGIARMIEVFARPDFQAGAKKFGVAIKDDITGNMRPLVDIIDEFAQKTKGKDRIDMLSLFKEISAIGSASGRGGTLGTIQARRAFAYLITNIDKYRNVNQLVRRDNNELEKSFEAMAKTPGVEWSVFINRLKVLIYTIGTQAIPVFMRLGEPLARAVRWFNGLSDHTKSIIATWGTFISVGMLVVGVIAAMGGGVARLVAQFVILRRMKALEGLVAAERAAQAVGPPVGGGTIFLPGGGVASRTQQSIDAEQEAARRQRSMPRAGGITAVGAGVGLAALVGLPILAQQSRTIDTIINKLGGMNTAMLTVIGTMALMTFKDQIAAAGLWVHTSIVGATRVAVAWTVSAARSSTAWVVATARSITSFGALVAAARTAGTAIATQFRIAAIAAATALGSIFMAVGWTALLIAVSYAVSYIITHWSKVKAWFGVFWRYMRAIFAAGWQFIIQTGKAAVYMVLQMVTATLRAILKVATYIPGIHGSAKTALRDINNLMDSFKPDYGKVTDAYSGSLEADARQRAARARQAQADAAARKAENDRWAQITKYWDQRAKQQSVLARNAALDRVVGITGSATATKTVQAWIQSIIKARQAMQANPYDVSKALAYEKVVKQLNDRFKDQPQLLAAINDVLQTYTSNVDKAAKATQKQQVTMEQMLQGVQSMYNNFLQQNQSLMGELNQGPWIQSLDKLDWGGRITAYDQMRDLRSRITQFKNFRGLLEKLRAEGAPPQLIQEFMNKGVGSIDELRTLTRMSKPELDRYFGMIRTAQKLVHQATMQDLRRQLDEYKTYGRQAALNIIAGVTSETPALNTALKNMITSAFGKIPTEAQIAAQQAAAQMPPGGTTPSGGAGTTTVPPGTRTTPKVTSIKPAQWVDPSGGRVRYVQHIVLPPAQLAEVQRTAVQWIGNSKKLNAIIHQYGKEPITQTKWADIYKDLEKEIRREFKKQKIPQLNELQLEKLIRIMFGFMPPAPTQAGNVAHVTTAQRGAIWQPNMDKLNSFLRFFNMPNWARSQIKPEDTLRMYRQLVAEIRREIRAQGLKMPTDKGLENLIKRRFHIQPVQGWDTQKRQTQGATTNHTYQYTVVAPKSEHATVQAQIRHGDFVIRNRHKPGR